MIFMCVLKFCLICMVFSVVCLFVLMVVICMLFGWNSSVLIGSLSVGVVFGMMRCVCVYVLGINVLLWLLMLILICSVCVMGLIVFVLCVICVVKCWFGYCGVVR